MKKTALLIISTCFLLIMFVTPASADTSDFTVNSFSAEYILGNDATGGSLTTKETIEVTFTDQNHGIFRAIPNTYRGYSTKLDVKKVARDGKTEPYSSYGEGDNQVLKIGDADKTITGKHVYSIEYYQERIVNFDGGAPEFYWDVNGNDWQQPFEKVSATFRMADGLTFNTDNVPRSCYVGGKGSQDMSRCNVFSDGTTIRFETKGTLQAGETLTVATQLGGVPFLQPTTADKLRDNLLNIAGILIGLLASGYVIRLWLKHGKDYQGRGVIVPEYTPPKGLSPGEVGMLADYRVDAKDLSATLIDLAVRGYVRLHEDVTKVLFMTTRSYSIELLNADFSKLKKHEKSLLGGVFEGGPKGTIKEMKKLNRTKMAKAVSDSRKEVKASLIDTYGMMESKAESLGTKLTIGGFVLLFAAFFLAGLVAPGLGIGLGMTALVMLLFGFKMPRRSHAGVETYEKILGLKQYMNVAEKDRLKMMQSVERPYAEPEKTVKLYETLLPFAVALGVEKSWSKQFDGIMTESPSWMTSNSAAAFSGAHLASSIGSATSSFGSSFETSSGASGGGSAGGGGGGGGGGGW